MRIDLSAPSGTFVARVSASVATVDRCPGRGRALPAADNDFDSVFAVPTDVGTGSAEPPPAATPVAQPTPSRSSTQGTDSVETTGPTASASASPGSPAPQTVKPSSDRSSTRTRRRTATSSGNAPPAVDYGLGPAGALDHLPGVLPPRRESHGRGRLRPPPRPLLLPPLRSQRCQYRPTATAPSLWRLLSYGLRLLLAARRQLDALGDAAELQLADTVARYSHVDWEREQQAEPTYHAAMRYVTIGPAIRHFVVLPFAQASLHFGHPGTGW